MDWGMQMYVFVITLAKNFNVKNNYCQVQVLGTFYFFPGEDHLATLLPHLVLRHYKGQDRREGSGCS